MACNSELPFESTRESLLNIFNCCEMICNNPEKIMPIRV